MHLQPPGALGSGSTRCGLVCVVWGWQQAPCPSRAASTGLSAGAWPILRIQHTETAHQACPLRTPPLQVGLLSGAAAAVHIEAPRVLVTVGPEEEEEEEGAAGAAAASGGSAARLRAGLALLAAATQQLPRLTLVFKDVALLQVGAPLFGSGLTLGLTLGCLSGQRPHAGVAAPGRTRLAH